MKTGKKITEHSLENMIKFVQVDVEKWNRPASDEQDGCDSRRAQ